ncbi:glutamate synthase large subunit [Halobaculum sp. MBLA0147]|uniref:glutamate synthase large subunit n=1 Tax=Halobaculum sp. MBLA0147 TaxID=3079934 RepID=UPI0035265878
MTHDDAGADRLGDGSRDVGDGGRGVGGGDAGADARTTGGRGTGANREESSAVARGEGLADPTASRANCGVGAVVDLEGAASHETVADALDLLADMEHRGARGAEPNTGDGAGVMLERPDAFFAAELDVSLPSTYAVGTLFLPPDDDATREWVRDVVREELAARDCEVLTWRRVPTAAEPANLGETARAAEPAIWQVFVAPTDAVGDADTNGDAGSTAADDSVGDTDAAVDTEAFDHALYVARRAVESRLDEATPGADTDTDENGTGDESSRDPYVVSLDRQRVVYKGLLTAEQLPDYFPDLRDERLRSRVALVHARFSTNTLGAWHLAHPYRNVVHNGEFNTLDGNVNWMRARESELSGERFDDDELEAVTPVVTDPDQSDTATVDEVLDLLLHGGRELPHALRMLVPEAYRNDPEMAADRRDFYDYHASLVEPWDGPALVIGFDGEQVAGVLDRNGLRPCRYDVTADGRLIAASEAGALETPPAEIVDRGRLRPGEVFVADLAEGRVVPDEEVFADLTDERYGEWVDREAVAVDDLTDDTVTEETEAELPDDLRARQVAAGYSHDQLDTMLEPMAREGTDPVGSMGDDTPLSVLSETRRSLFDYFVQSFAQVSNPPIDYIREDLVTTLETRLGPQRDLLSEMPAHARQVVCDSPVLTDAEARAIRALDGTDHGLRSVTVDTTFAVPDDEDGGDEAPRLAAAVADLRERAAAAVRDGADVLVLSDERVGADRAAIPALLATAAVHTHLVDERLRAQCGLVVRTEQAAEVHHVACLIGYGAGAVHPALAYDTVRDLVAGENGADPETALTAYREAVEDGLSKTMARMGISALSSYQGAAVFGAVGLDESFLDRYFTDTESKTAGIGVEEVQTDALARHAAGYDRDPELPRTGEHENRSDGERHGWNPDSVSALHSAVRSGDHDAWEEYAAHVNDPAEPEALRDTLTFAGDRDPVPIAEVEPVSEVVQRFSTAAMSLGSLSPEAHETNAQAMNRIGGKSNTGEGGEPPERFDTERECHVKQVASGRFGVTAAYLRAADEIQIKMAQGSKPGEGGHLPGSKVNDLIAHVRCSTPGVGLISPPPQHDIYSIEDLKQLIYDLKAINPDADVNVKLVAGTGIGTIAAGVAKANADAVHVSGHSGGTGASPRTSIKHAGLPWEIGLAETNQLLHETDLRDRIRVSVDGGLKTGRDVAVGALLGAEEFAFGTASLVSSGCVMARQCHQNTCPVGVATQREELRERFPGEPDHVIEFMRFVAQDLREIMAELGFRTVDEMVGRPDCLEPREDLTGRAATLDPSAVLADPVGDPVPDETDAPTGDTPTAADGGTARTKVQPQPRPTDRLLDRLCPDLAERVAAGEETTITGRVDNADRAVGATLSGRVVDEHGGDGLADDTVSVNLTGAAGQSFGAFLAPGVTARVTGTANDYVAKGLSGGRVIVETPEDAGYDPATNVAIGNVALYGATDGELYVEGVAGERFAVRNSGVRAVVEGAGDHCCEYMTGGVVAVLGAVGRNFAAGMSGGVAYVYDPDGTAERRVNRSMVSTSRSLSDRDRAVLRRLVENHAAHTGSERAAELLDDWETVVDDFLRVLPDPYADVLAAGDAEDVRTDLPSRVASDAEGGFGSAPGDD